MFVCSSCVYLLFVTVRSNCLCWCVFVSCFLVMFRCVRPVRPVLPILFVPSVQSLSSQYRPVRPVRLFVSSPSRRVPSVPSVPSLLQTCSQLYSHTYWFIHVLVDGFLLRRLSADPPFHFERPLRGGVMFGLILDQFFSMGSDQFLSNVFVIF